MFVTTKNIQTLEKRLAGRGTESKEVIAQRLRRAAEESEGMEEYDYLVINDQLDACVTQIHSIIESEHLKTRRNQAFVGKIREELKRFSKGE